MLILQYQLLKETKALLEDADANGFTYDNEDADCDEFIGKLKDKLMKLIHHIQITLSRCLVQESYQKRVKEFFKDYLKVQHIRRINETLAASGFRSECIYEDNEFCMMS